MIDEYDLDDDYQSDHISIKDEILTYSVTHKKQELLFLKASKNYRQHHAWLLQGPKGLGKRDFALKASRWILSQDKSAHNLDIPLHDADSQLIDAGTHPDFQLLEANHGLDKGKKSISVDTIRHLQAFIQQTPSRGSKKVCIIDSADQLNANSSNALLKILEEPPKHMVIFILNHSSQALLPTLKSRCFKLAFRPLADSQMRQIISQNALSEEMISLAQGIPSILGTLNLKNWREISEIIDQLLLYNLKDTQSYFTLIKSVFSDKRKNEPFKTSDLFILILLVKIKNRSFEEENLENAAIWAQLWSDIVEMIDLPKAINLDEELLMHQIFTKLSQTRHQRI